MTFPVRRDLTTKGRANYSLILPTNLTRILMETMIGIYDAKRSFSALLEKVARGERFIITNRGAPVAILVPIEEARSGQTADEISSLFADMRALASGRDPRWDLAMRASSGDQGRKLRAASQAAGIPPYPV